MNPPVQCDTYHVTMFVDYSQKFIEAIEAGKKMAQDFSLPMPLNLKGYDLLVHPTGIKLYPFHLQSGDVHIFLNKRKIDGVVPNTKLCVGSMSSQKSGILVYENIVEFLTYHDCPVISNKINRFDLSKDLPYDIKLLPELTNFLKLKTRSRNFQSYYHNQKLTGVVHGAKAVMCRIYDKVQEMNIKRDLKKMKFFNFKTPVTRVEFQYRREFLSKFNYIDDVNALVDTVQDAFSAMGSLWAYSTKHWIVYTEKESDKKNNNYEDEPSVFWKDVQETASKPGKRKHPKKIFSPEYLFKQGAGCIIPACAVLARSTDYEDVAKVVMRETKRLLLYFYQHHFPIIQGKCVENLYQFT